MVLVGSHLRIQDGGQNRLSTPSKSSIEVLVIYGIGHLS